MVCSSTICSDDRITQLMIDQVTLTAEAGVRLYEAMVHEQRAAIHHI